MIMISKTMVEERKKNPEDASFRGPFEVGQWAELMWKCGLVVILEQSAIEAGTFRMSKLCGVSWDVGDLEWLWQGLSLAQGGVPFWWITWTARVMKGA